jgi:putative hemolysin
LEKITASGHSHFPVIRGEPEEVIGILHAKDVLAQSLRGGVIDIQALIHPALFVPESTLVLELLRLFKSVGANLAIVIDE